MITAVLKKNEKGIGLVEVVAALGVSVIVLTSLVSLSLFTIRSSLRSKLLLEGSKIANRELELVRGFRDSTTDWENGTNGFLDEVQGCIGSNPCSIDYSSGLSVNDSETVLNSGTAEQITYYFTATNPDDGSAVDPAADQEVRITVVVEWEIAGEPKSTRLYTDLTNWNN